MPTLGQVSRHKAKQHRQLLMLMTILTQAFFALVRGHLVSLMLLSVWHNCLIIKKCYTKMLFFVQLADSLCQFGSRLEVSDLVCRNRD